MQCKSHRKLAVKFAFVPTIHRHILVVAVIESHQTGPACLYMYVCLCVRVRVLCVCVCPCARA